jgi:UDPglucose 6-dehydrogenase
MGKINNEPMSITEAVQQANLKQQQHFADRVIKYFKQHNLKTVCVWGLAFKAKTDDVRESPAIFCINRFVDSGIRVQAFDPEAMAAAKAVMNSKIDVFEMSYDALNGADALVIFTDWQEFRNPDFTLVKKTLNRPVIFDGRNLYSPQYLRNIGFEYYSIGRPG